MVVSILLSVQGVNMLCSLKKSSVLFAAGVLTGCWFIPSVVWAEGQVDKLELRSSVKLVLTRPNDTEKKPATMQKTRSLLSSLELFRGVTVDLDPPAHADIQSRENRESPKSEKDNSMIKAVYGGLQIALKENLSLVYSPGRLSREGFDASSQGLYLLTGDGGQANWYMGVESATYARSSDLRRTANTAQFGVILSLD